MKKLALLAMFSLLSCSLVEARRVKNCSPCATSCNTSCNTEVNEPTCAKPTCWVQVAAQEVRTPQPDIITWVCPPQCQEGRLVQAHNRAIDAAA